MEFNKDQALMQAEGLAEDFNAEEAEAFSEKHQNASWYNDFKTLFDMVTDKNYSLETSTYAMIAGALAYVVFPIDVIPDFIPGVGFIDDIFVLGMVVKSLSDEIERYKKHRPFSKVDDV